MMITASDFHLISVEAVATTPERRTVATGDAIKSILTGFHQIFDGAIEANPESQAPLRIPPGSTAQVRFVDTIVGLSSADNRWKLSIHSDRTSCRWNCGSESIEQNGELENITRRCVEPLIAYPFSKNIQVGRLGLVVRKWLPCDEAAKEIAAQFCMPRFADESDKNAPFRHSSEFQLHNLKKYASPVEGIQVNSWVRCLTKTLGNVSGIGIEHDINTPFAEAKERAFQAETASRFFAWAAQEMDHILQLYFNGGSS